MSVSYNPQTDRYNVCPQCGPFGNGYGNYGMPNCYSGPTIKTPTGSVQTCDYREKASRSIYDPHVMSSTCNYQSNNEILYDRPTDLDYPFAKTYGISYFGNMDPFRLRPYGKHPYDEVEKHQKPDSNVEAFGEKMNQDYRVYEPNMMSGTIVPGMAYVKTLASVGWPSGGTCVSSL